MHFLIYGLGVGLLLLGMCNSPGTSSHQPPPDRSPDVPVEINIENNSTVDFDSVVVAFPSQREIYGAVAAGSESDYRTIEQAYRYAYVEAHAADTQYVYQPFDYSGEESLAGGRYTYALNFEQGELTLKLVAR